MRGVGRNQWRGQQNNVRETREDVKKFLTFYKRTKSICIDLYCPAFYKRKPYYDELADFVHDTLCPTAQLRTDLQDVQLHPVKKNLFIKFKTVQSRDIVAASLAGEGLEWPAFNTKVQGWAMDKPIVFVRVLGASPESSMQDVKGVLGQYGEVLEVRKGQLSRKLPNVTNGTWTVRMIVGEDKIIPSFVFVKDDGEIWQLAHDNQETICWQCGKQGHIGSRCKEKAVSIEHDLVTAGQVEQPGGVPAVPVQTWAHVVRGVGGQQQAEADRVAAERVEAERVAAERVEAERMAAERADAERVEVERVDVERVDVERVEAERVAAEGALAEREAANEDAERETAGKVATEATEREAEEKADTEAAQREAAEKAATEAAKGEAADKAVTETAEKKAAEQAATEADKREAAVKAVENKLVAENSNQVFDFEEDFGDLRTVRIALPCDNILNPAKLSKIGAGSAVPSSCEPLLGSSPDLPHKVAGGNPSSDFSPHRLDGEKVEEVFTQYGSSISPYLSSGQGKSESADLESFSDAGSSNAMRPDSASSDLE